MSPIEISSHPSAASSAATRATAAGATAPSYGHPNAVETYPRVHMPAARAWSSTGANAASDSAMVMFTFARAKPSEAAVKTAIASAPAATARSRPRRFGTRTG